MSGGRGGAIGVGQVQAVLAVPAEAVAVGVEHAVEHRGECLQACGFDAVRADRQEARPRQRDAELARAFRVEAVQAILKRHLVDTPSLETIAKEVGCSPFYLSRTFSKETGQTIPQYVRQLRLERAAELLRTGRYNVTEVALEVGYNSLSHFSQAFHQTFGCCPGLYPMSTATQRVAG